MDLALTFVQSNNGKTLTITDASESGIDLTGAAINITFNDIVYAVTLGVWVEGSSVDVTTDTNITPLMGTGGPFIDGIYLVEYSNDAVGDPDVSYNIVLDYNVAYCVYNQYRQLPDVHACQDLCTNDLVSRTEFMGTYLKALRYSSACGQMNEVSRILLSLQNLCLNPGINECYCS